MRDRRARGKRKAAPTAGMPLSAPPPDDVGEDPEGLSPAELAFVDAVASGQSLKDGAVAANICYRSAKTWHRRPEIVAAIRSRVSQNLSQARSVLASGSARAARSLVDMSDGRKKALAPKVTAARAVIETSSRLTELEDISARLAELEARISKGNAQ